MDYSPNREVIAARIARIFETGSLVNLGIGLPTLVANYIPEDVEILLQSENGFIGIGPVPPAGAEDPDLINAGGVPVTILPGGAYFDSATSFGIIRGGSLANYKTPGKLVPETAGRSSNGAVAFL